MKNLVRIVRAPLAAALVGTLGWTQPASAALITIDFDGSFTQAGSLFAAGDTFSGSYTFESGVATVPHPDPTLQIQAAVIGSSLPGTGWSLQVASSTVGLFSLSGSSGAISVGNDTAFGDRYIATLSGAGALPLGMSLNFLQIDLQDAGGPGADMLSASSLAVLPNLALASSAGGRFFTVNDPAGSGACSQCAIELNAMNSASVSEPGGIALLAIGLLGLGHARRRPRRLA